MSSYFLKEKNSFYGEKGTEIGSGFYRKIPESHKKLFITKDEYLKILEKEKGENDSNSSKDSNQYNSAVVETRRYAWNLIVHNEAALMDDGNPIIHREVVFDALEEDYDEDDDEYWENDDD